MRLRSLAALAGMAIATVTAPIQLQAQSQPQIQNKFGIYLTPTASRISNSTPDSTVFAFLGPNNTSNYFKGFAFGGYDEFYHSKGFDAGLDAHLKFLRGDGAQLTSFMVGARVAFKPESVRFRPYAQVSGGVGSSKPAHNPRSLGRAQYEGAVGIDYPLGRVVDFRVVEVGYGAVQTINSNSLNGSTGVQPPSSRLLSFSTGIVFHIH